MILADFIFKDKKNRLYFWLAIGLNTLGFIYFKSYWFQPANFSYSSAGLIDEAASNASVGLWPIGYAKVLWFFHLFAHSDIVVIAFQYFFLHGVLLYFFFTLHYFYRFAKNSFLLLFVFLFFDPLFLYLSNFITADAIFTAVSLWWFTELVWIIHRPKPYHILVQSILLFVAFTLSYQAAWYPFIALAALLFSPQSRRWKITGIVLPLLMMGTFIAFTTSANFRETGVRRFSILSGWRAANNTLYLYPHINIPESGVGGQLASLDDTIRTYFEKVPPKLRELSPVNGLYYLVTPGTPLQTYLSKDSLVIDYRRWASVSVLYADYAGFLASHYPGAYARFFLLSNTGEYFWPRIDKLTTDNMDQRFISENARQWFGLKKVPYSNHDRAMVFTMLGAFPILFPVVNIVFLGGLIWLLAARRRRTEYKNLLYGLGLSAVFIMINAIGNIWFFPIVLESLLVSLIVAFSYVILIYDIVENKYKTR